MQCDLHSSLSDCLIEYMHILKIDLTAHRYHPCVQLSRKRPLESSCQSLQFTSSCVQHYNLKLSMEHGKPCHLEYLCDQAKKIHRSNHYQPVKLSNMQETSSSSYEAMNTNAKANSCVCWRPNLSSHTLHIHLMEA